MIVSLDSYEPMDNEDYNWTVGEREKQVSAMMDNIFLTVVPPLIEEGLKDLFPLIEVKKNTQELYMELTSENSCLGRNVAISFSLKEVLDYHIECRDADSLTALKSCLEDCLRQISKKGAE